VEWRLGNEREVNDQLTCRSSLRWALGHLASECSPARLDTLVELVDRSMTLPNRHYHDLAHALMVAESNDPLEAVIGLFHDIVQADVDGGLPPGCEHYLAGLVSGNVQGEFTLLDSVDAMRDPVFDVVKRCFGFSDTQTLSSFAGKNEFLSALIACKALSDLLDVEHLAAITLGIEATVPFRKEPHLIVASYITTLGDIGRRHQIRIDEPDMRSHIRRAIRIANRDVRSFGEYDLVTFLQDTWNLMYESSIELRSSGSMQLMRYRQTLQKMTRFLSSLTAPMIFKEYDGEPILSDHRHRLNMTTQNLALIADVMHAKLLAIALIEAVDGLGRGTFIPAHLKAQSTADASARFMTAQDVLATGSSASVEFGIRQSPLSHQLSRTLPRDDIRAHVNKIDLAVPVGNDLFKQFPTGIQSQACELARVMLI
jgi:hypothetical protein